MGTELVSHGFSEKLLWTVLWDRMEKLRILGESMPLARTGSE